MGSRRSATERMVRVRPVGEEDTVEFFESAGNAFARIGVDDPAGISEAPTDLFPVPVERAFSLHTSTLTLDRAPTIALRGADGQLHGTAKRAGITRHEGDPAVIEFCLTLKVYILVEGAVTIEAADGTTHVRVEHPDVRIGVRAPTHTPTGTVSTTPAIEDVFATVGALGANMTDFHPSRAFPRERAHPPSVTFAEGFELSAGLSAPDTDITIEAPATYLHAAMAAPLAYFLGADLRPANAGALLVSGRRVRQLGTGAAFGDRCSEILRRCILGESILAGEVWYDIEPAARQEIGEGACEDWAALTDASLSTRVEEYLAIPASEIDPFLPGELQPAYVAPTESMVECLPFLSYDLASVRPAGTRPVADGGTARAGSDLPHEGTVTSRDLDPRALGNDIPIGQHPAFPQAFRNRVTRDGQGASISVRIVCNDARMTRELDDVRAKYTARSDSPIDVDVATDVSPEELADLFARPTDYLHYIGHIDAGGFVCAEGHLDTDVIDETAVELFFLNSCKSAGQAMALIEASACAGIATHHRVRNSKAVAVGSAISRGLIRGFPLGISLATARYAQPRGDRYTIVGDPKADLTGTESGIPYTCRVREVDDDRFVVAVETHLTESVGPGSLCSFHLAEDVPYFVHPTAQTFEVDRADLIRFLELEDVPVWMDGDLRWSEDCVQAIAD